MKRLEHMIWIRLSQTDQPVAVGPKVGPPGPFEDIWGPQKGLSGPKRALLGAPGVPYVVKGFIARQADRATETDEM